MPICLQDKGQSCNDLFTLETDLVSYFTLFIVYFYLVYGLITPGFTTCICEPWVINTLVCILYLAGLSRPWLAGACLHHRAPQLSIGKFNCSSHCWTWRGQHSDVFTPCIVELKHFKPKCPNSMNCIKATVHLHPLQHHSTRKKSYNHFNNSEAVKLS